MNSNRQLNTFSERKATVENNVNRVVMWQIGNVMTTIKRDTESLNRFWGFPRMNTLICSINKMACVQYV